MSENKIGPATEPKTKWWQLSGAFRDQKRLSKRKVKSKKRKTPEVQERKPCDGARNLAEEKSELEPRQDPLGLELE